MDRGNLLLQKGNKGKPDGVDVYKSNDKPKALVYTNHLLMQHLLEIQERWISKETEIRKYVSSLHKFIKQKDMKIEMMEMENASLRQRLQREINQNKKIRDDLSYPVGVDRMQSMGRKNVNLSIQRTENVTVQNNDRKNRLQTIIVWNENIYDEGKQIPKIKSKGSTIQQNLIHESYDPKSENRESNRKKQLELSSEQIRSFYYSKKEEKIPQKIISVQKLPEIIASQQNQQQDQKLYQYLSRKLPKEQNIDDNSKIRNENESNKEAVNPTNEIQQPQLKQKSFFSQQVNDSISQINEAQMQKRIMDNIAKILKQNSLIPSHNQRRAESHVNSIRESRNTEKPKKIIDVEDEDDENCFKVVELNQGTKSVLYYQLPENSRVNGKVSNVAVDNSKSGANVNSSIIGLDKSLLQTTQQHPVSSLQSSFVNFDEPTFTTIMKKDRKLRKTTTTEQTYEQRFPRGSSGQGTMMMIKQDYPKMQDGDDSDEEKASKKCQISCVTAIEEQKKKEKQTRHRYKSSKTITFSNEPQMQYLANLKEFEQHDFHSQNKITLPHNIDDVGYGNLSPYTSGQGTPYQSGQGTPQGSARLIKLKSVDVEEQEKISQVGTVKRNQGINNNNSQERQQRKRLQLKNLPNYQVKNSTNNNITAIKSYSKHNLSSQKVYEETINISPSSNNGRKIDMDKKSYNNSEDDPFSQLIQEPNSSKHFFTSPPSELQGNTKDHQVRRSFERKKTRFNTKFTNLEYSLTESYVSLSEIEGSVLNRERENSNPNNRFQFENYGMSVVEPIQQDVRNERESFKVEYEDHGVQAESENQVRKTGNFGQNRLIIEKVEKESIRKPPAKEIGVMTVDVHKIESQQQKIQKIAQQQQPQDKMNPSNKTQNPKQNLLRLNGRATLLLEHNSQTESKLGPAEVNKPNNQPKPSNSTKKLSMSSSQDSKFCYPNQQLQQNENEKKEKEKITSPSVHECNIKHPSSIEYGSETSSKQKKFADTQIQYDEDHIMQQEKVSSHKKDTQPRNSINIIEQMKKRVPTIQEQFYSTNPVVKTKGEKFTSPKHQSRSFVVSYSPSNNSNNFVNDPQINDWERKNTQSRFKKQSKLKEDLNNSDTKNFNKSEFYIHQSTKMKQPYFDQGQYECYTASNKSNKSAPIEDLSRFTEGRSRLGTKERNVPETKSTTFNNHKSHGANFYVQKSSSSEQQINNHAFKKMYKFTTQSQQQSQYERQTSQQRIQFQQLQKSSNRQRQSQHNNNQQTNSSIDINRILFENSMLRAYNRTLQEKVKKPGKMDKLMEKFNSQNVSIRNKIHKKSIY